MKTTEALHHEQMTRVAAWGTLAVVLIGVTLGGLLARVVQLKLSPDPRLARFVGTSFSTRTEMSKRGDLLDRSGRVIATSRVGYRLFVDPSLLDDPGTIAVDLAELLDADPIAIDKALQPRLHTRYVRVIDLLEDWQVAAIRDAELDGVGLEPTLVRTYPNGDLAAGIVGTVGFEHTGLGGFEHMFDERMAQRGGRLTYLRDARRRALWIDPEDYHPAEDGEDVRLSLDLIVQGFAEKRLLEAVRKYNCGGGRLVVADVETGEILAMCDVLRDRDGWEPVALDPPRAIHPALGRNRCATDPYEPGSTFKPFVWALSIEGAKAHPEEILDCPEGEYHVTSFGRRIRDAFPKGPVSWERVLVHSLNSGMSIVAERMDHDEMREGLRRFGFGQKTACGLPGETAGMMTGRATWSNYTQTSVAFGHEISVTPLQMVRAFSAIARDGTVPGLRLTARSDDERDVEVIQRVMTADAAATTRTALRRVMVDGPNQRNDSALYELFGKSGTPQLPKREGGGYHEDRYMPNFIAGGPYRNPRLVVTCVLEDPDKSIGHYGGQLAGPVVRDVLDAALQYLGVPPDKAPTEDPGMVARP